MKTATDILDLMGSAPSVADLINAEPANFRPGKRNVTHFVVNQWRYRNRIPQDWYAVLVAVAARHNLGITYRDLALHVLADQNNNDGDAVA